MDEKTRTKSGMQMTMTRDGDKLTVAVVGRVDSTNAPKFNEDIINALDGVTDLVLDLEDLDYISSSGLRVLMIAQTVMNNQGTMEITNVTDSVMEVLEMTGFADCLTIL